MTYFAAVLIILVSIAHSVLGEIFLIKPLIRAKDLPPLRANRHYTERLVRVAWHVTSLAWLGFAAIFILIANPTVTVQSVATVMAVMFLLTGLVALITSKERHLSWIIILAVAVIAGYVSTS